MRLKSLTHKELMIQMAIKANSTPLNAEKWYKVMLDVLEAELKRTSRVTYRGFGTFHVSNRYGYDKNTFNPMTGKVERRFIEARDSISFEPAENLTNRINGKLVTPASKKRRKNNKLSEADKIVEEIIEDPPTTEEMLEKLMARQKKNSDRRKQRIEETGK